LFFDVGKEEREDGAVMDQLVALDDAGGDPEAEAGAVEVLGGVEGFEDAGADGGGHAVAGVGDGDADALRLVRRRVGSLHQVVMIVRIVGVRIVGADDEAAALAHGVDGVGDEVVEDLADVVFEAEDFGWTA
jgi:hypothetical protein